MEFNTYLKNKRIAIISFILIVVSILFLLFPAVWATLVIALLLLAYYILKDTKKEIFSPYKQTKEQDITIIPTKSHIYFNNIAGLKKAKKELLEITDFLKNPDKYKRLNARIPKGVLLIGPPGVGKTMLVKALSSEANVPFYYQSGASFVEIYVGMGAKKVKALFDEAKKNSPSIIFIDEIDSVGKKRDKNRNDEREATLNQLLTQMDGFDSDKGVIVIGATNKPDVLDDALLRAGRFDRRVVLELPSLSDRIEIFNIYIQGIANNINVDNLAQMSVGFSAADIENFINEAKLEAIRNNKELITDIDFANVKDKILYGLSEEKAVSKEDKKIIALYQASKAFIAKKLGVEFEKITLYQNSFLKSSTLLKSNEDELKEICILISGSLAYDIMFNKRYANAKADLEQARGKIKEYLKNFDIEKNLNYKDIFQKAKKLFDENFDQEKINSLSQELIKKESIYFDEIL